MLRCVPPFGILGRLELCNVRLYLLFTREVAFEYPDLYFICKKERVW